MKDKVIKVFHTHLEVYPYQLGESELIERKCSLWVESEYRYEPLSYMVLNDTLYLPRGFSLDLLVKEFKIHTDLVYPRQDKSSKISEPINLKFGPRDRIQEAAIDYLMCKGKYIKVEPYSQQALILRTGAGKTYITIAALSKLKRKAIIITHQEKIKKQWLKAFENYTNIDLNRVININGKQMMLRVLNGKEVGDFYLVNHRTLGSFVKSEGPEALKEFFKKIEVGIKVYDEAHLEFADTIKTDFFSNTKKTFYLTATFDRSDNKEARLFFQAFSAAYKFDQKDADRIETTRKYLYYVPVLYNSHPTYAQELYCNTAYGLSTVRFAKRAFERDPTHALLNAFCDVMDKIVENEMEGKIIITVGLIDNIEVIEEILRSQYPDYIKNKKIMYMHSKQSKEDNEEARNNADIILSTIKSAGTGVDIIGLRAIINLDPFSSKVTSKQLSGRLREYASDKYSFLFDLIDMGFRKCTMQFGSKKKYFKNIAYKVQVMDVR